MKTGWIRIGRHKVHLTHKRKLRKWLAMRNRAPYFCLEAPTRFGAVMIAAHALKRWREMNENF